MLFNININQGAYSEIAPTLSIESACLLNMMQQKMSLTVFQKETIKEGDNLYFWFSHSFIKKEMPILFKGSESDQAISLKVRRWIAELENNGLIKRHTNFKSLKKSMYCFTEKADALLVKSDTYKNERVNPKQTFKNERVTRTKMNESTPIQTFKNEREEEYTYLEEKEEKRESEIKISPPPPAPSALKTENPRQGHIAAAAESDPDGTSTLDTDLNATNRTVNKKAKIDFDDSAELYNFLKNTVFPESDQFMYMAGVKGTFDITKVEFSEERFNELLFDFSLHPFKNLAESKVVRFSISECYTNVLSWIRKIPNFEVYPKQSNGKPMPKVEKPYTEGYLKNILIDSEKGMVDQLKEIAPDEYENYIKRWRERALDDITVSGTFAEYAKKKISTRQKTI